MKHVLLRILASIIPMLSVGFFAMSAKAATVSIQAPAEVVVGHEHQVRGLCRGERAAGGQEGHRRLGPGANPRLDAAGGGRQVRR